MNENDIIEIIDENGGENSQQAVENDKISEIEKKVSEVKFDPIEPDKEQIEILDDEDSSNSKSGLPLVIILFVLLIAFIIFLPKITEIFGSLF